jgi:hypothetical protein
MFVCKGSASGGIMKLYRIDKVSKPGGIVLKKKHVLAVSDKDAVQQAADSDDCPVCEVLKDGKQVGSIA